jgi:hypothetical protein
MITKPRYVKNPIKSLWYVKKTGRTNPSLEFRQRLGLPRVDRVLPQIPNVIAVVRTGQNHDVVEPRKEMRRESRGSSASAHAREQPRSMSPYTAQPLEITAALPSSYGVVHRLPPKTSLMR